MPKKRSSEKRQRQNEKQRLRNKMVKSRVKTSIRKLMELVESKDKENAQKQYRDIASLVDRAASKGTMPRNTAARKKRRLHRSLSKLA